VHLVVVVVVVVILIVVVLRRANTNGPKCSPSPSASAKPSWYSLIGHGTTTLNSTHVAAGVAVLVVVLVIVVAVLRALEHVRRSAVRPSPLLDNAMQALRHRC
jgi:quinol-cytochrome oxidoreductase complex cytochrome b subunit